MSNMCKSRQDNSKRSCDSCLSDCMIRTVQARTQKPKNAFRQLWQQWRQLQDGAIRKQPLPWEPTHPSLSRHLLPEVATVCWRKCKHLSCCCTCYHHESSLSCHWACNAVPSKQLFSIPKRLLSFRLSSSLHWKSKLRNFWGLSKNAFLHCEDVLGTAKETAPRSKAVPVLASPQAKGA